MQRKGRIHWRAVMFGYLFDYISSLFIGAIAYSVNQNIATESLFASTTGIVYAVLGVLMTVIGGFIAGRIAKEERFLHGFLVGGIGIVVLLLEGLLGAQIPLENIILTFVATVLAGVAGYLSRWTPARERGK